MPRYVILLHEMPERAQRPTHWDLMLESGDALRTWALAEELAVGATIEARQLADHRPAYLAYEGPVSGDRGSVSQWDAGSYSIVRETENDLELLLEGRRLSCRAELTRRAGETHFWIVSVSAAPTRG